LDLARSLARAASPALGLFWLGFAAISAVPLLPGAARAEDYPRLGIYGIITGDGYPYIVNGVLQDSTLDQVSRRHQLILDASPVSEFRPDVLAALRARRPDIKLFAYVLGHNIWNPSGADSMVHFPTRYYRLVRDHGAWLYNTAGSEFTLNRVNLAKRDLFGRFVLAEALADLFYDVVVRPGIWDGIFLDVYCKNILWMETPAEHIDYARAGYPSLAAFDAAWGAAIDTLGNRLWRMAGPSFEMLGNCTPGGNYKVFNGWMRENFPFQGGGDWYQNMFREPDGYFLDEEHYRTPLSNYIFSAMFGANPYSGTNTRIVRFGLGSAALGNGYATFGPADKAARPYPYQSYWYDEYAVDLTTGRSSPSLQHTGWLGQPLGTWSQMIWLGPAADAVTNPDFETDVTTGWNFNQAGPATRSRDATDAAVGSASVRITIPVADPVEWAVAFNCADQIPLAAFQPYSATFWAKASAPRRITVAAGATASRTISITTAWRQYQVTLIPHSANFAGLQFFLAQSAGEVWLDDVHFQAGVTNLYRRDFQNGIVLVNPSAQALTVPLERDFRKILGTRDPVTNDGAITTQATVASNDALFLIGDDRIAPSPIMDLQPGPAWTPRTTRAKRSADAGVKPKGP
jgi:hypothetical protein